MIQLISNLLGHENRICSLPGYEHCSTDIGLFLMEMIVGMVFCVSRKSNWGFPAPKKKSLGRLVVGQRVIFLFGFDDTPLQV